MNAEYGDITRTKPDARLVKTCGATASAISPPCRRGLAGCELLADHLTTPDRHDQASQHPLPVLASRVERGRSPVAVHPARLVDVAVEPYGGLVPPERIGHRLRACAVVNRLPVLDHGCRRPYRGVQLQTRVQARVERGAMEVEDGPRRVGNLGHHLRDHL